MSYRTAALGVIRLADDAHITPRERAEWVEYQAWLDAGGVPEPMPVEAPPTEADESYLTEARRKIDAAAGRARMRYITAAPGQEATYAAKYADARAYVAAGYPPDTAGYPWIAAEAAATGLTPTQTADRIKLLGDAWGGLVGPAIEGRRIAGKDALAGLTTRAEVDAAVAAAVTALEAI